MAAKKAKKTATKRHVPLHILIKRRNQLNKIIAKRGGGDSRGY